MRLTHFIHRFCSKSPTNEKTLAFRHCVSESMISVAALTMVLMLSAPQARPQDGELQKRVAEIKQYLSLNKIVLAQYRWQESQTVSVKGEVKKEELFQVQIGSDGQPQKTNLRSGRIFRRPQARHQTQNKGGLRKLREGDRGTGAKLWTARAWKGAAAF